MTIEPTLHCCNRCTEALDAETLDGIVARLRTECDDARWATPANRSSREYAARQALNGLTNFRSQLADYEEAVVLSEAEKADEGILEAWAEPDIAPDGFRGYMS